MDLVERVLSLPVTRPVTTIEFRLRDGIAHASPTGFNTALCGMETTGPAPAKAVPCERCLVLAAEKLAAA